MSYKREAIEEVHHTLEKWGVIKPTPYEIAIDNFKKFRHEQLEAFPASGIYVRADLLKQRMEEVAEKVANTDYSDPSVKRLLPYESPFPTLNAYPDQDRFDLLFAHPTHELFRKHPNRKIPEIEKAGISILRNQLRIVRRISSYPLPQIFPIQGNTIKANHHPDEKFALAFALWALEPKN
jgi:hypothetical protein